MRHVCVLVAVMAVAVSAGGDEPQKPSADDDLKALQGHWTFVGPKANAYSFVFDGKAVTFSSSGPAASLPRAKAVPFEIEGADGKRVLKLDEQKAPEGIGRAISYRLDGDRLVLTITDGEKGAREYKLARRKQDKN